MAFLSEVKIEHVVVQTVGRKIAFMHARRQCRDRVKRSIVGILGDQRQLVLLCDSVWAIVRMGGVRACALVHDCRINHVYIIGRLEINVRHNDLKECLQLCPWGHCRHLPTSVEGGGAVHRLQLLPTAPPSIPHTEWQTDSRWHTNQTQWKSA